MKPFSNLEIVQTPREVLWPIVRDQLPDLASCLEPRCEITELSRETGSADCIQLVNRWRALTTLPPIVTRLIQTDTVEWTDHAIWDAAKWECSWRIVFSIYREQLKCSGTTLYERALGGKATRVTFSGQFSMDARGVASIPAVLAPALEGAVETFAASLIPGNLRKLVKNASQLAAGRGLIR